MSRQGSYRARFDDPTGARYGLPTYNRRSAPAGLATRRQLRAAGLAPGGHDPVALIGWVQWGRDVFANLYALELAVPKRTPSPAQLEAIAKALAARRTCPICLRDVGYCLPKSGRWAGQCVEDDCATPAPTSAAA